MQCTMYPGGSTLDLPNIEETSLKISSEFSNPYIFPKKLSDIHSLKVPYNIGGQIQFYDKFCSIGDKCCIAYCIRFCQYTHPMGSGRPHWQLASMLCLDKRRSTAIIIFK